MPIDQLIDKKNQLETLIEKGEMNSALSYALELGYEVNKEIMLLQINKKYDDAKNVKVFYEGLKANLPDYCSKIIEQKIKSITCLLEKNQN